MRRMSLVTSPTSEPVTLTEAKEHLRVTGTDEDDYITALIVAARQNIDGYDGWLGRAIMTQTWDMKIDGWEWPIKIPLPPLQSVTSVKYLDSSGVEQTLATDQYRVLSGLPSEIHPEYSVTWPLLRSVPANVTVRFVAGYANAAAVPQPIKTAMHLMIGTWFENREQVVNGSVSTLPLGINDLLYPLRANG